MMQLSKHMLRQQRGLTRQISRPFLTQGEKDPYDNIPESIMEITRRKIYKVENHPLSTMISKMENFFYSGNISDLKTTDDVKFKFFSDFPPLVKVKECFDDLGIPEDHVSRRITDTYYKTKETCLRPHTSVH